jgi:DNA primase
MTADQIVQVLRDHFGIERYRITEGGTQIAASCPFAAFKHAGGADRRPSFYVRVGDGEASPYHCFACGTSSDDLRRITWQVEELAQGVGRKVEDYVRDPEGLRRFMVETSLTANMSKRIGTYDGQPIDGVADSLVGLSQQEAEEADRLALEYIRAHFDEMFERAVHPSVFSRGITQQTAERWNVRWDRKWQRVVLPVVNRAGEIVGVSGRATNLHSEPKYLHYPGLRKSFYLYGENLVDASRDHLVVVEGFFDAMMLSQQGYNACAIMGSHPSRAQIQTILDIAPNGGRIVVWLDGDAAGKEGLVEFKHKVAGRVSAWQVWVEGKDPKHLAPAEVQQALVGALPL